MTIYPDVHIPLCIQTSERKMLQKEHQNRTQSEPQVEDAEEEIIYRIDIPANRYDMMCLEGISRALNIFSSREKGASYKYRLADMTGEGTLGRRS
jgi:phenylalanyl-tRNA synthetase beta chain